jgi:hypothetical protein
MDDEARISLKIGSRGSDLEHCSVSEHRQPYCASHKGISEHRHDFVSKNCNNLYYAPLTNTCTVFVYQTAHINPCPYSTSPEHPNHHRTSRHDESHAFCIRASLVGKLSGSTRTNEHARTDEGGASGPELTEGEGWRRSACRRSDWQFPVTVSDSHTVIACRIVSSRSYHSLIRLLCSFDCHVDRSDYHIHSVHQHVRHRTASQGYYS